MSAIVFNPDVINIFKYVLKYQRIDLCYSLFLSYHLIKIYKR